MTREIKEMLATAQAWRESGHQIALATVLSTWGSAPRRPGAWMLIRDDLHPLGSVSAGCVEAAVLQAAEGVIAEQRSQRLRFGVSDEDALSVGLACGGEIDIFVQPLRDPWRIALQDALESSPSCTLATALDGEEAGKSLIFNDDQILFHELSPTLLAAAKAALANQASTSKEAALFTLESPAISCFFQRLTPPPRLVIIGGGHIATTLAPMAQSIGFEVVLVDPRPLFANRERFPHVDQLLVAWPHEAFSSLPIHTETYIALLTHDPKIDDPALQIALQSPARYIGALGSRRTHAKRLQRLHELGCTNDQTNRIHAPIGLPIHALEPPEIAISILAQIIQIRRS